MLNLKSLYQNKQPIFLIIFIVLIGICFRLYGLNWDQGFHLHPDERAIILFTTALQFPQNIIAFLSQESSWNPHFFAYGSLPLYLLKILGGIASNIDLGYSTYEKINVVGRILSALFDLGTLLMIFLLGKKLFNQNVGLIGAFFYSVSVLPIQLSHFYAVDTLLTFFVLVTLWWLIHLYENPIKKYAVLAGVFFGFALATKVSASVLIASLMAAITADFILIFLKNPHRPHIWFPHIPTLLKRIFLDGVLIAFTTIVIFILAEPYALIDFQTFLLHNVQQRQMTYDPFTFPYTLQYVGKIPYLYELKNIFFWGMGPLLAAIAFLGTIYVSYTTIKQWNNRAMILLSFFWIYFLVVGNFAIGFMRYMLPLYPLLSLFAAVLTYKIFLILKSYFLNPLGLSSGRRHKSLFLILNSLFIILIFVWPVSFMHIYTQPNTRVAATEWIHKNIPYGKSIAVEHWDDGMPLAGQQNYTILTLPLYESDTPQKWQAINQTLAETDYIIIASNRLYVPLMKLTNCEKLPPGRCYTQTAKYYKRLFSGQNVILNSFQDLNGTEIPNQVRNDTRETRFQKVAEFSVYPSLIINLSSLIIDDSSADESFTVYDHPKVMIFQREK